jgi:hypothetical protein
MIVPCLVASGSPARATFACLGGGCETKDWGQLRSCNKTSTTATCVAMNTSFRPRCSWVPPRFSLIVFGT